MSAMHLRLSLPPRAETPGADIEVRPSEVERWLSKLPVLNVSEAVQMLTRQLVGINRVSMEDRQRLRLLEMFRVPVATVCQELVRTYQGLPLPLPDKARQIVAQIKLLQTEMAYGYKLIVFNSTAMAKLESADKTLLSRAIHRAIRYLTELMFRSYELYSPPPEGNWFEIHQLCRYAELLGILSTSVEDKLNNTVPSVSIGHAYKQALLLDFSDPYHLPARMLARIYRYLDRYADLAELTPGIAELKAHCQFLINLDNDRAGAVNTEASPITTEVRYRLLNTTELAKIVHQQLTMLQAGHTPEADGLEKDFFAHMGQDLLVRLIFSWGVNPKRVFTRSPRDHRRTEVAFGIEAINYFCNGGERFAPSSNEVGPQPQRTTVGTPVGSLNKVQQTGHNTASVWEQTDESAGGYALAKSGANNEAVRVGDMLAARVSGSSAGWEVGVVRWVRTAGSDGIELGVQRIAPHAHPVAIMPLEETQDRFFLALALPEVRATKQPSTIVTQRGFFKSGRILYLDDGYRTKQVKAVKLVELSGAFERFQFEHLDN